MSNPTVNPVIPMTATSTQPGRQAALAHTIMLYIHVQITHIKLQETLLQYNYINLATDLAISTRAPTP